MTMQEENPNHDILEFIAKRGNYGATRNDLLKAMRGIPYSQLEMYAEELEKLGYVTIDWTDVCDFVITVTPKGLQVLQNT